MNEPAYEAVEGGFECDYCGATRETPVGMARHREFCRRQRGSA